MKKGVLLFVFLGCFCSVGKLRAQTQEAQQLLLDVEKLAQLKSILADMKKGYQILSGGYETIKSISQGSFDLHKAFLDGLLDVSPVVKTYKRIADVVSTEGRLVSDYKRAYKQFKESNNFTAAELQYIASVYAALFDASLKSIDALLKIVTAGELRMSDEERLSAIDAVWKEVEDSYTFLKHFNNNTKVLALQRAREGRDVNALKNLYNLH